MGDVLLAKSPSKQATSLGKTPSDVKRDSPVQKALCAAAPAPRPPLDENRVTTACGRAPVGGCGLGAGTGDQSAQENLAE